MKTIHILCRDWYFCGKPRGAKLAHIDNLILDSISFSTIPTLAKSVIVISITREFLDWQIFHSLSGL